MSKCVGCGVKLQTTNSDAPGYVDDLSKELCERCFKIKYYGQNIKTSKANADYIRNLNNIGDNDIAVYVSSILTLNLDYIDRFKKVILVITKRDVLPKSVKDNKIINYVKERHSNIIDVIIVSAYKKKNLDCLYNKLCNYKSKIYFVGITNSGKSTLINEMINSYGDGNSILTVSNYPSTTLDMVKVKIVNLSIIDTPGLIIPSSIANNILDSELKRINSKKEIKPITIQMNGSGGVLVDKYFRIEYETNESSMVFYVSNNLNISKINLNNPRLSNFEYTSYDIGDNTDLVIEDIGFIKFTKGVRIKVFYENKMYMYLRDKLI